MSHEPECLEILSRCLRVVTLAGKDDSQVVISIDVAGIEAKNFCKLCYRLASLP